jgi:hypothetical protein
LDSDAEEFGGHKRVTPECEYTVDEMSYNDRPYSTLVGKNTRITLALNGFNLTDILQNIFTDS